MVRESSLPELDRSMEIQMNHNTGGVRPAAVGGLPPQRPEPTPSKDEMVNLAGAAAVDRALEKTPDIRADVVERARKLVADPAYPPRETILRLSHLLAIRLPSE